MSVSLHESITQGIKQNIPVVKNKQVAHAQMVLPFVRFNGPFATSPHFWQGTDCPYMIESLSSKINKKFTCSIHNDMDFLVLLIVSKICCSCAHLIVNDHLIARSMLRLIGLNGVDLVWNHSDIVGWLSDGIL